MTMRSLSKLFQELSGKIIILLALLVIELITLIWKLTSDTRPITTVEYLRFIEEKNPTICYTKEQAHVECRVCLSEFEEGEKVRSLKCNHTFHRDCLDKWLQQNWATCPLCRKHVLPHHVVLRHRQQLQNLEGGFDWNNNDEDLPYLLFALRGGNTSNLRRYLWNPKLSSRYVAKSNYYFYSSIIW